MSEKRKISIRKIMQVTVTVIVTGTSLFAMLSAASLQKNERIKGIEIKIRNKQYHFIDKDEVEGFLANDNHQNILATSLGQLNSGRIEKLIVTNPWVAAAQVYVDNSKIVHINLTQRVPVARLFDQEGNSYYLDHTMSAMPLSAKYIHYTTVVTNVPVLKDDSISKAMKAQIVSLVNYIEHHEFWRAQISQIIVADDRTFEVVPVLGNQKILVGDTSRLAEKFDNLLAFYKKVLDRIGWDKYQVLDVRYAGQVVASPALPWKAPVDVAMSSMSWMKNIVGKDSGAITAPVTPTVFTPVKTVVPVNKPATVVDKKDESKTIAIDKKPIPNKAAVVKPVVKKQLDNTIHKKAETKENSPPKKPDKPNKEKQNPKYLYH